MMFRSRWQGELIPVPNKVRLPINTKSLSVSQRDIDSSGPIFVCVSRPAHLSWLCSDGNSVGSEGRAVQHVSASARPHPLIVLSWWMISSCHWTGPQKDLRTNSLVIESSARKIQDWLVAQSDNLYSEAFPQKHRGFFSAMFRASLAQSAYLWTLLNILNSFLLACHTLQIITTKLKSS